MIPAVISSETASPGERALFAQLRDDPGTSGWVVLHSLEIPEHKTQIRGEADFIILAPELGILCLEVKGHRRVARGADGQWRLGNDPPTSRSPFKQAADNMHSLLNFLSNRREGDVDGVVIWSAVAFTRCDFRVSATEWNEWEVLDRADLDRRPIGELISDILRKARNEIPHKAREGVPTENQCLAIARVLRPRFEMIQTPAARRAERDAQLLEFTEEQFLALDGMARNPRVIFEGPAGTGKTFLALEAVRRSSAMGARTGLFCFNQLLGQWLAREVEALGHQSVATNIHRAMLDAAGLDRPPRDADAEFFTEELPELAVNALLSENAPATFSRIIVDEAQDLLRDSYLDFLDVLCDGGLASGHWTFFGDFERQALFDSADVSLEDLQRRFPDVPLFSLRINCRNTRRVASWVTMLAGLAPPYSRVRRPDEGWPPRTHFYSCETDQQQQLVTLLDELYQCGFRGDDIVLLSTTRDNAGSRIKEQPWRDRVVPIKSGSAGHIRWSTVQAFKGLEAPVIVITDVAEIQGDRARALFYTGATRSTERLYVLAEEGLAGEMADLAESFRPEGEEEHA